MTEEKSTCVNYYIDAIKKYASTDAEYWAFAAGFCHGQAEKVHLGACRAAMFRPSAETAARLVTIVVDTCFRFGLVWQRIGEETWICRPKNIELVRTLLDFESNSSLWHKQRAWLCGVPEHEVDEKFHERPGYGVHTEPVTAEKQ